MNKVSFDIEGQLSHNLTHSTTNYPQLNQYIKGDEIHKSVHPTNTTKFKSFNMNVDPLNSSFISSVVVDKKSNKLSTEACTATFSIDRNNLTTISVDIKIQLGSSQLHHSSTNFNLNNQEPKISKDKIRSIQSQKIIGFTPEIKPLVISKQELPSPVLPKPVEHDDGSKSSTPQLNLASIVNNLQNSKAIVYGRKRKSIKKQDDCYCSKKKSIEAYFRLHVLLTKQIHKTKEYWSGFYHNRPSMFKKRNLFEFYGPGNNYIDEEIDFSLKETYLG